MNFLKHIGTQGDRKVAILYRTVPNEDHMCLVIYPQVLPAPWHDTIMKVLESAVGQQSEPFADALHRSLLPDGRNILETLHAEKMIKKIRTADVLVTPTGAAKLRLDELNKMLNEMKQGDAAIKRLADNDASRGMVAPDVKRRAEAEYKANQAAKAAPGYTAPPVLKAGENGVLSDRDIASNMLAQAQSMEANAKAMIAEAAKMKKDAEKMDPTVKRPSTAKSAFGETPAKVEPAAPARRTRGPNKVKTAVADGAK
jgi:hypothetical protein